MKQFSFKVTVNIPEAAEAKIKQGFAENDILVENRGFFGSGFEGRYSIVGHEVTITIIDKPMFVSNERVIREVKQYLAGV